MQKPTDVLDLAFPTPTGDRDFMLDAPCRYDTATAEFFPAAGTNAPPPICAACPVKQECLAYALDNRIRYGWWGETSPDARDRILRGVPARQVLGAHGTNRRYKQGCREQCCRDAHSADNRRYQATTNRRRREARARGEKVA